MNESNQDRGRNNSPSNIIQIILIFLILAGTAYTFIQNSRVFGEKLVLSSNSQAIPTITLPYQEWTPVGTLDTSISLSEKFPTREPPAITPTPTAFPMCNSKRPVSYFLFIAKDYEEHNKEGINPEDYSVGFADALRLVRIDFRDASVEILSIPRDLIVAVPLAEQGIYEARLNITYAYGNEYDVPGGGASLVAQTLASNFGIQIDHYVIINFWAFVRSIEAIGGIDVNIPETVGPFQAGEQHFNGWQALAYARLRSSAGEDTSDASRVDRQTEILYAIQDKVFSEDILPNIMSILPYTMQLVQTDLTNRELENMICIADKINSVELIDLSPELYTKEIDTLGNELLIPDYIAIREFIQEFQYP